MRYQRPVPRFLVVLLYAIFWFEVAEIVCNSVLIWTWPR